jgi:hypothetical protein
MKFVSLNGMPTINTLFLEVKKDTVFYGNTKMKRFQLWSRIFKYLNCSIEEKKEHLVATLFALTAQILILWLVLWS